MDRWKTFWAVVVNVWEHGLYGIGIGRITVVVFIKSRGVFLTDAMRW